MDFHHIRYAVYIIVLLGIVLVSARIFLTRAMGGAYDSYDRRPDDADPDPSRSPDEKKAA